MRGCLTDVLLDWLCVNIIWFLMKKVQHKHIDRSHWGWLEYYKYIHIYICFYTNITSRFIQKIFGDDELISSSYNSFNVNNEIKVTSLMLDTMFPAISKTIDRNIHIFNVGNEKLSEVAKSGHAEAIWNLIQLLSEVAKSALKDVCY